MPKSSPNLQRSWVLVNGHSLFQVWRSVILWKRILHKEFGIISRKRCCWNSPKADAQFSVQQLHCPEVFSKAKDVEKLSIHFAADEHRIDAIFRIYRFCQSPQCLTEQWQLYVKNLRAIKIDQENLKFWCKLRSKGYGKLSIHFDADQETMETVFRTIVFANQLSLYGAVANICEEFDPFTIDQSNLMHWWDSELFLSEIKAEVPLDNDIPLHQNLLLQRYEKRIEMLSQENKVSKFCLDAGFIHFCWDWTAFRD